MNSKPKEVTATTSLLTCTSSDSTSLSSSPTCGSLWLNSRTVPNSEGFCCACSLDQMLGFGSHQRGEVACNLFSGLFGSGASVHCLRWGSMWYSLFRLLTPTVESEIVITSSSGIHIQLSAAHPVESASVNGTLNITARLVGSFAWTRAPTDWGLSYYAASPNVAASSDSDAVSALDWSPRNPFKSGLLIPQAAVDLSGRTCNKIGVSHTAFVNNQGSRCSANIGDCLHNQIDDMIAAAATDDLLPKRLCQAIGGRFVPDDGYRLSCVLTEAASDVPTQVLLELNADHIQIVVNESQGLIFNVTLASSIQALVQRTSVTVTIANTGELTSEFIVEVADCDPPGRLTVPLNSIRTSIRESMTDSVTIKIEDAEVDGTNYTCSAVLQDSEGAILDSRAFSLNISSVDFDKGVQGGLPDGSDVTGGGLSSQGSGNACTSECSSFVDVLCSVKNLCWSKLGSLLGVVGGSTLALFLMGKFGVFTLIVKGAKTWCNCSGSRAGKRRNSEITSPEIHELPYYGNPPPYNPYYTQPHQNRMFN